MEIRHAFSFAMLLVGSCLLAAAQWLLIAYLARNEGPESVGAFTFSLSCLSPAFAVAYFGLRPILVSDAENQYSTSTFFKLRSALVACLALIVLFALTFVTVEDLLIKFLILVFCVKASESLSDICYGAMYRHQVEKYHGMSLALKAVAGTIAFLIGVQLTGAVTSGFCGVIVIWITVLIFHDLPRSDVLSECGSRVTKPKTHVRYRAIIGTGLPLALSAAVGAVLFNVPNYALAGIHGLGILGVYSAMFSLIVLLNLVCITAGQIMLPILARTMQQEDHKLFFRITFAAVLLTIVLAFLSVVFIYLFAEPFLNTFYGEEIAKYSPVFFLVVLAASPMLIGQVLSYAIMALKEYKTIAYINLVALFLAIASSYPVVAVFDVLGAAMVGGIVGITQIGLYSLALRRRILS